MQNIIYKAGSRGVADHGWLKTSYSFSFSNYHNPERMNFGLLRVLNDDWIAAGEGFGMHPHDNMEIVTIVKKGELEHKDSMGHTSIIKPNEVQVMSAGTGIFHSEFNHSKTDPLELFQVWIFTDARNHTPRYDQKVFDPMRAKNKWQTLVSPNQTAGLFLHQQAWFSLIYSENELPETYKLNNKGNGLFLFVVDGEMSIGKETLGKRDAIGVWDIETVDIVLSDNSELLAIEVPMK
jgi:redox-sensitive bicupin YhaK (pirin superfamily)